MKVLVVDDDINLCASLKLALNHESMLVDFVHHGRDAIKLVQNNYQYDAIILDKNLPQQSGLQICATLREQNIHTPIIILSITNTEDAKVEFLNNGADDYLIKPFSVRELTARLRALTRRAPQTQSSAIKIGELMLDTIQQTAKFGRHSLDLPRKQYLILEFLVRHQNEIVTRETIVQHVWGDFNFDLFSNALEAHMCELRKRLRTKTAINFIHTINGRGYKFAFRA